MAVPALETDASLPYKPRFVDIGINLSDPIFRGRYHGTQKHPDDLAGVVDRARQVGCTKLIVTGSDVPSSLDALTLCADNPGTCYATVGIHPCSSAVFGAANIGERSSEHTTPCERDLDAPMSEDHAPDMTRSADAIAQLNSVLTTANKTYIVALGEFGLDYDRLNYCNRAIQKHSFDAQLKLAVSIKPQLPLFLHSRAAHADFVTILKDAFGEKLERLERGGVVHSFTGTIDELHELMELGLYIGINGCSFKTADNCEVVKAVALDRIMIETDGPWCEVRPSHEGFKYLVEKSAPSQEDTASTMETQQQQPKKKKQSQRKGPDIPRRFKVVKREKWEEGAMIKGRNEPCMIECVAKIVAAIKGVALEEVCEAAWRNTVHVFGLDETI